MGGKKKNRLSKKRLEILLKNILTFSIITVVAVFLISDASIKVNAAQSEEVKTELYVDKASYKAGEKVNVCFSISNYNDSFTENITTMIIELGFDEETLTADKSSLKKIADDNGGMGFSHISIDYGNTITYQYVNVSEPLKKGSSEIFSASFNVNVDVSSIEDVLNINSAIIQDGTVEESVRFPVTTSIYVDKKAQDIVNDNKKGEQVYDNQGELIDSEKDSQSNTQTTTSSNSSNNTNSTTSNNNSVSIQPDNNIVSTNDVNDNNVSKYDDKLEQVVEDNSIASQNTSDSGDNGVTTSEETSIDNVTQASSLQSDNSNDSDNQKNNSEVKNQTENQSDISENSNKNIWIIIAVIALVAIVGVITYIVINNKKRNGSHER